MVSYVEDDPREPLTSHVYRSESLTRTTPDGPETRDFFVFDTLKNDTGKVIIEGLSNDAALAKTLTAPDIFWKAEAVTETHDNAQTSS